MITWRFDRDIEPYLGYLRPELKATSLQPLRQPRTYALKISDTLRGQQVKELVSGKSLTAFGKPPVKPRSTVVLYRP